MTGLKRVIGTLHLLKGDNRLIVPQFMEALMGFSAHCHLGLSGISFMAGVNLGLPRVRGPPENAVKQTL